MMLAQVVLILVSMQLLPVSSNNSYKAIEQLIRVLAKNPNAKLGANKANINKLEDEKNHEARFASRVQKNRLIKVIETQKVSNPEDSSRERTDNATQGDAVVDSYDAMMAQNEAAAMITARAYEERDKEYSQNVIMKKREVDRKHLHAVQQQTTPPAPEPESLSEAEGSKKIVWDFTRKKRAVHDYPINWVDKIPYVIHSTYQAYGPYYTTLFKRSLQYMMDNVCLTFVDETSRWNSSDPNWFTKNGYTYDTYISVQASTGCSAYSGPGSGVGNSPRIVYPCQDFVINMHEMMHTIGVAHTHQGFIRENYITINNDDIQSSLIYSYDEFPEGSDLVNWFFDPSSPLMYGARTWTRNGNEAYTPIRDDLFNTITSVSADQVNFMELVNILKCTDRFCGGNNVDCAPGYYSYVKGVCRCVCPDEFDVTTNCKTLKNGPSPLAQWPNTPMVVFAGGPSHSCPTGFDPTPGWFSFTGSSAMSQSPAAPVQYPVSGKTNSFPICTRNLPEGTTADWESWPAGGQYCFIKPAGVSCGGGFAEAGGYAVSAASISTNGSIGDITISSNNISIKACCRYQEYSAIAIDLPDGEPFRLLTRSTCPTIRGLKAYNSRLNLWTTNSGVFGPADSPFWWFSTSLTTYSCYYQPGVYDCNELVTLDANNRSVTIRTPYLPTDAREPNRRCFYVFNSPPNSQILITFNRYSLSTTMDDFLVKKYHPWQVAFKLDNSNYPAQILSESNYLSAEAFMGYAVTTNYGVNFTAKVILPEDYCYNPATNGADYRGKTAISETYEPCIEWSKAVNCSNFPKSDQMANILSGNQCRNPDGRRGPWCYTYINGTNCNIRYCDACNFKKPLDSAKTCSTFKQGNPDFCSTGLQRFACFVYCNFTQQPTARATCGPPIIPDDSKATSPLKSVYNEGEKVQLKCALDDDTGLPNDMYCTPTGWEPQSQACLSECGDKVKTCDSVMSKSPTFCVNANTLDAAQSFCALSCGFCPNDVTCSIPTSTTYTRTSALDTIKPGQVMTFTCNTGQYYVSGDLSRACSMSGNLLGTEPVCQSKPVATDVNLNLVRRRVDALPPATVVILDKDGFRIPFDGNISTWYYFSQTSEYVYFNVYRRNGTSYTLVGYNKVFSSADFISGADISAASQISVQKDDIIGVFTLKSNTLSVTSCKEKHEKLMVLPIATNVKVAEKLSTAVFSTKDCYIMSFGCKVTPV